MKGNFTFVQLFFLKGLALVYLFAFASWYVQIASLYGKDGLVPINLWMKRVVRMRPDSYQSVMPTVLWYQSEINDWLVKLFPSLSDHDAHENVLHVVCVAGMALSAVTLVHSMRRGTFLVPVLYALLYGLYLSVYHVGQTFASFQWDILLLEVGVLAVFFTPKVVQSARKRGQRVFAVDEWSAVCRELLRWLAFRLYYASGVLKLASQCPTWWNLTALNYHFESQCLPHVLSWYFHQIPETFKRFMVAANFVTLIGGSLLFFVPVRSLQVVGAFANIMMQIMIILSGNYNFFNILAIFITCIVFDNETLKFFLPGLFHRLLGLPGKQKKRPIEQALKPRTRPFSFKVFAVQFLASLAVFVAAGAYFFPLDSILTGKLTFDLPKFSAHFVHGYVPRAALAMSLVLCAYSLFARPNYAQKRSNAKSFSFTGFIKKIVCAIFACAMYALTSYSFFVGLGVDRSNTFPVNNPTVQQLYQVTMPYSVANSYGLFRRMTGVYGREELVIEGTVDGHEWRAYELFYKPSSDLSEAPQVCIPHQPRLDWQMWFAAMAHEVQDPYIFTLLEKIFAQSEAVRHQLIRVDPFPGQAPLMMRVRKHLYHFTTLEEKEKTGNYWKRDSGRQLFGPVRQNDQLLSYYLDRMGIPRLTNVPLNPLAKLPIKEIIIAFLVIMIAVM